MQQIFIFGSFMAIINKCLMLVLIKIELVRKKRPGAASVKRLRVKSAELLKIMSESAANVNNIAGCFAGVHP